MTYVFREHVTASTAPESVVVPVIVVIGSLCTVTERLTGHSYDVRGTPPDPPRFKPPAERGRWWERR